MIAGALGVVVLLIAFATVGLGVGAQAASQTFQLYSQINPTLQPTPDNQGSNELSLTVTPSSAAPGDPIEIVLTSSTLNLANGPASTAAAGGTELDAVVALDGTDYVLRGSQTGQDIPANDPETAPNTPLLFKAGWVVSSTPGNSSSTSYDGQEPGTEAPGTTGLGTAIRGAEATIVPLVAPATPGTFPLTLKAIVLNSIAGSGTPALNNGFDSIINTKNCTTCTVGAANDGPKNSFNNNVAASYITFSPTVDLTVAAPTDTGTGEPTDTSTGEPTDTGSPTDTATATPTVTENVTETATVSATATVTETAAGPTVTVTQTADPTATATVTETAAGPTVTVTETADPTATATVTETAAGPTVTQTVPGPTVTATVTATSTSPTDPCRDHGNKNKKGKKDHCDNDHGHGNGNGNGNGHGWWSWWWGGWWGGGHDGGGSGGHGHGGWTLASSTAPAGGSPASLGAFALIAAAMLGSLLYVRKARPQGRHR